MSEMPEVPEHSPAEKSALERRNRGLGLVLGGAVIMLFAITYFRMKGMAP